MVEVDVTVERVVESTSGSLYGIPVTIDSTAIWVEGGLTSDMARGLRRLKAMAAIHGMIVLSDIDMGVTAVEHV